MNTLFPTPILAETDLGQIVIFIVAAAVAFINWLIQQWKQRSEAASSPQRTEEAERRHQAWKERQLEQERERQRQGQGDPYHAPEPQSHPSQQPQQNPTGGSFDDIFREIRRTFEPEQQPPVYQAPTPPPPLPRPQSRPVHKAHASTPPAMPVATADSHARVVADESTLQSVRHTHQPHPLTRLLRTPDGYRQAFVLREVLGPPRALQDYQGPD